MPPFNRIRGFYLGHLGPMEENPVSTDKKNDPLNEFIVPDVWEVMTDEEKNDTINKNIKDRLDTLNLIIEQHEKALRAMTILRDASCVYKRIYDLDENGQHCLSEDLYLLGVVKWNGSWRLCHGRSNTADPEGDTHWKPLADSSVMERICAVKHFDKLLQAIIDDKAKLEPEIEQAITTALASLERFPGGTDIVERVNGRLQAKQGKKKK